MFFFSAVKTAWEGLGVQSLTEDLEDSVPADSAPGCVSNNVLGEPQGFGHGEARERATSVDTRGVQVREVRHQESGYAREPRRLDDVANTPN